MPKSVSILLQIGLLLFFSEVRTIALNAQDLPDVIVLEGDFSGHQNASWSADSRSFSFASTAGLEINLDDVFEGVIFTRDAWHEYNLETGDLTRHTVWPLQPLLSLDQIQIWEPKDFIYTAPDEMLGFYNRAGDGRFVIVNLQTEQVRELNQSGDFQRYNPDAFVIRWNGAGNVVIAQNISLGGIGSIFYVSIPENHDLTDSYALEFGATDQTEQLIVFAQEGDRLYALAPSGNSVLLSGRDRSRLPVDVPLYEAPTIFIVWQVEADEVTIVELANTNIPFDIIAAAFSPVDESKLVMLHNNLGLIQVGIDTGQVSILNDALTSVSAAYFSPDGRWLAVFEGEQLRFLDVTTVLQLAALPSP